MNILLLGDHVRSLRSLLNALRVREHKCDMKKLEVPQLTPGSYDAVVVDLLDNEDSGAVVIKKIKETIADIPVYVVFGRDYPGSDTDFIKENANKIFYKPLDIERLQKNLKG